MLAAKQENPIAIAVDPDFVYWMNEGGGLGGKVMKVPLCGGTPITLGSVDTGRIGGMAVSARSIFWTHYSDGTVMQLSVDGGNPTVFASGLSSPSGIAVDSTQVYWADYFAGQVLATPLGGGASTTLVSGQSGPDGVAVDANNVYFTNDTPIGTVMKAPLGGGEVVAIGGGQNPRAIAVGGTTVAWATATNVMAVPIWGGNPVLLSQGASNYTALAVDATTVYWADKYTPFIDSAPVTGGRTDSLVPASFPLGIAVDCASVYWTDVGGTVKKFTPK